MSDEIGKLLSAWEDRRLNREGQSKLLGLLVDETNNQRDEIDQLQQQNAELQTEIDRLKHDLSRAMDREAELVKDNEHQRALLLDILDDVNGLKANGVSGPGSRYYIDRLTRTLADAGLGDIDQPTTQGGRE